MTSSEIRGYRLACTYSKSGTDQQDMLADIALMLQEVAAQLAELNELSKDWRKRIEA